MSINAQQRIGVAHRRSAVSRPPGRKRHSLRRALHALHAESGACLSRVSAPAPPACRGGGGLASECRVAEGGPVLLGEHCAASEALAAHGPAEPVSHFPEPCAEAAVASLGARRCCREAHGRARHGDPSPFLVHPPHLGRCGLSHRGDAENLGIDDPACVRKGAVGR
eukprot:scaffold1809_cov228-Pinguiococcus_pyrenoidosus.AAC.19